MKKRPTSALWAEITALAQANVRFEGDVIQAVAEQGDMTSSDAQGLVDFGSFAYVQAHGQGCSAGQIAGRLLEDTRYRPEQADKQAVGKANRSNEE